MDLLNKHYQWSLHTTVFVAHGPNSLLPSVQGSPFSCMTIIGRVYSKVNDIDRVFGEDLHHTTDYVATLAIQSAV